MTEKEFMNEAFRLAYKGMREGAGGPFGAVVVSEGKIIGKGYNCVLKNNDPTAHAEIMAIRDACSGQGNFHLPKAVLYSTCEPCPMCLSAIYWADISSLYYALNRNDADKAGFGDKFIYSEIAKPFDKRKIAGKELKPPNADKLFEEWDLKNDKRVY